MGDSAAWCVCGPIRGYVRGPGRRGADSNNFAPFSLNPNNVASRQRTKHHHTITNAATRQSRQRSTWWQIFCAHRYGCIDGGGTTQEGKSKRKERRQIKWCPFKRSMLPTSNTQWTPRQAEFQQGRHAIWCPACRQCHTTNARQHALINSVI